MAITVFGRFKPLTSITWNRSRGDSRDFGFPRNRRMAGKPLVLQVILRGAVVRNGAIELPPPPRLNGALTMLVLSALTKGRRRGPAVGI
ncbi:MAG: hypothetical protein ACJ8EN_16045 [Xanthobacteraceae bacterium]